MTPGRRRGPSRGTLAWRMLWSMSYDRPVRVTFADGAGVRIAKVVANWLDPRRSPHKGAEGSSPLVFVLAGGEEIALNSIAHVQLPMGDSGAAFAEGR